MNRQRALLLTGIAMVFVGVGFMFAKDKPENDPKREADKSAKDKAEIDPKREADKLAIEKLAKDNVKAFENRDAAAIAAQYTTEGEFIHNDGEVIQGRAEIQKGFADFFKTLTGKPKLEYQLDKLRFPSTDTAVVEVTLRLMNEEGEIVASSWRNTLLVREAGKWKVAIVREWDRDVALDTSLKEIEWLIGTWQATTKDREVTTTYEWDENKAFIRGKFTVKEGGKVIKSGTQMLGKDNSDGVIRSWVFQSDGGFGGGVWARDGKKWTEEVHGVMPDGKELTGESVYIHVDSNSYTWQAVNRQVDGEPVPDTLPIKVTKQKPSK